VLRRSRPARADVTPTAQRTQDGTTDMASTWPGTGSAHHLTYLQDTTIGGTSVRHRAEWVYADLPDGTQVVVGVLAPVDLFDEPALHDVLASWRPTP